MGYWGKSMKSWIPWWPFYYLTSSSLFLDKKSVDKPPLYRVLMSVLGGWSGGHGRGAGSEGTYRRVVITLYRVNQGKEGSYIKWVGLIAWKKWGRLTNLDRFHKGIFMWSISTDSVGPYIRFFFFYLLLWHSSAISVFLIKCNNPLPFLWAHDDSDLWMILHHRPSHFNHGIWLSRRCSQKQSVFLSVNCWLRVWALEPDYLSSNPGSAASQVSGLGQVINF